MTDEKSMQLSHEKTQQNQNLFKHDRIPAQEVLTYTQSVQPVGRLSQMMFYS